MVVPILAPITNGTACERESEPDATTATIMAVTVELLCISAVINSPTNKPTNGLLVAKNNSSANRLFNCVIDTVSRSIENIKSNKPKSSCNTENTFLEVILLFVVSLIYTKSPQGVRGRPNLLQSKSRISNYLAFSCEDFVNIAE